MDELEPIISRRELAEDFIAIMNCFAIYVTEAENSRLAAWQAAIAIGLPCCARIENYEHVARICGVGIFSPTKGRSCVSKGVKKFQDGCNLPPSFFQKRQEAAKAYQQSRDAAIDDRNEKLNERHAA